MFGWRTFHERRYAPGEEEQHGCQNAKRPAEAGRFAAVGQKGN